MKLYQGDSRMWRWMEQTASEEHIQQNGKMKKINRTHIAQINEEMNWAKTNLGRRLVWKPEALLRDGVSSGEVTVTFIRLADFPGGGHVPRPACMLADVHRPAQGVQELQKLRLYMAVGRLQQTRTLTLTHLLMAVQCLQQQEHRHWHFYWRLYNVCNNKNTDTDTSTDGCRMSATTTAQTLTLLLTAVQCLQQQEHRHWHFYWRLYNVCNNKNTATDTSTDGCRMSAITRTQTLTLLLSAVGCLQQQEHRHWHFYWRLYDICNKQQERWHWHFSWWLYDVCNKQQEHRHWHFRKQYCFFMMRLSKSFLTVNKEERYKSTWLRQSQFNIVQILFPDFHQLYLTKQQGNEWSYNDQ